MNDFQKHQNTEFFKRSLNSLKEGGFYMWPDMMEVFIAKGNKFYGTKRGIKAMKAITHKSFHNRLVVQ